MEGLRAGQEDRRYLQSVWSNLSKTSTVIRQGKVAVVHSIALLELSTIQNGGALIGLHYSYQSTWQTIRDNTTVVTGEFVKIGVGTGDP